MSETGLSWKHQAFVDRLTNPAVPEFCNPSAAYRYVYPRVRAKTSWERSCRLTRISKVRDAMAKQWGIPEMGSKLKKYVHALESTDPKAAASVVMNYAELTGQLIKKSETTIKDEQRQLVAEAVRQLIQARLAGTLPALPPAVDVNGTMTKEQATT